MLFVRLNRGVLPPHPTGAGMRRVALVLLAAALAGCGGSGDEQASDSDQLSVSRDGWKTDFSRHVVPLDQFLSGGPGKDGIPAIDEPRFMPASRVDVIERKEPVIELVLRGERGRTHSRF